MASAARFVNAKSDRAGRGPKLAPTQNRISDVHSNAGGPLGLPVSTNPGVAPPGLPS